MGEWYEIGDVSGVASPALVVYPERVEANIRRTVAMVGGDTGRLRPHVKTHKMAEVARLQMAAGIGKFKCATPVEAEMLASCGAEDVLLAMQPCGPDAGRLAGLAVRFPGTRFGAIVDDVGVVGLLGAAARERDVEIAAWLDLDCGMGRSGIAPGDGALAVYRAIVESEGLRVGGVHAYDGHLHQADLKERSRACEADWSGVEAFVTRLRDEGFEVPALVGSGSPTYPVHAGRVTMECSPGTTVFWDAGYGTTLPDLEFEPAALVVARVVSKPGEGRLCLGLGHKAVAAENPIGNRVRLMGIEDAVFVSQSEEHLVIETAKAGDFGVGDVIYGVPWHVCPTVALYDEALVVRDGKIEERWKVNRGRRLENDEVPKYPNTQ